MTEEWRTVPGHPSFEVSNLGNVRQLWIWFKGGRKKFYEKPFYKIPVNAYSNHVPWIGYAREGKTTRFSVRVAVLDAFTTRPENVCKTCPYYYTGPSMGASLEHLSWRLYGKYKNRKPRTDLHSTETKIAAIELIRQKVGYDEIAQRLGIKGGRGTIAGLAYRAREAFGKKRGNPALWLDTPPVSPKGRRLRKLAHPVEKGRLVPIEKRAVLGGSLEHLDLHTFELAGAHGGRPHERQALPFGRGVARRGGQDQRDHDPR